MPRRREDVSEYRLDIIFSSAGLIRPLIGARCLRISYGLMVANRSAVRNIDKNGIKLRSGAYKF